MTQNTSRMSLLETSAKEGHAGEGTHGAGAVLVPLSDLRFPPDDLARILRSIQRMGSAAVGNVWGGAQALVAPRQSRAACARIDASWKGP